MSELTRYWTWSLVVLAGGLFLAWLCALLHEKGVRPLRAVADAFGKHPKGGWLLLFPFFVAMFLYGGTKPGDGGGDRGLRGHAPPGLPRLGPVLSANTSRTLEAGGFERGFVMTRIGTGESFDFSAPSNAVICQDWRDFGAATDRIYLAMDNWSFRIGTNDVSRLRIHSFGKIEPLIREVNGAIATNSWFAPFVASLGIVPQANWSLLNESDRPSQVWYAITPEGSLLVTWQNALLGRASERPVSFQAELCPDGRFAYRYDLSRLGVDAVTNVLAGASFSGNCWTTNSLPTNATSMAFYPLSESDAYDQDPDNDGLLTIDELFLYNTDPHNADSDYDGLDDGEELFTYGSDPLDPNSISETYCDGFAAKLGDLDPFSCPEGSTNTVLEHVFYSGTTNGVFSCPISTNETAVLKVMVSGSGVGRLIVGESVVPLVPRPPLRSGVETNTLLLAVGKGVRKEVWFDKPDGLDVAIDSDDLLIGEMPTWYWVHGWLAFPHAEATVPCIHDFRSKGRDVSLVHGEEFAGLTATWSSEAQGVSITNVPPVSAEIHGSFPKSQERSVSYTIGHPDYICGVTNYEQTLRFCPQFADEPEPSLGGGGSNGEEDNPEYWSCECAWNGSCGCCSGEWCHCWCWSCPCNASQSPTLVDDPAAEESFTNVVEEAQQTLADVFYLYRANTRPKHLVVPSGTPAECCPCPEHRHANYVAKVAYTSRVMVNYADGSGEFEVSHVPCDVTLSGVSPSRGFSDSTVVFVTNGVEHSRHDCTVLGVRFESDYNRPPLSEYNQRSPSFGYPAAVCTNIGEAATIVLRTDVLLTNGVVKLSMLKVTGDFQVWLPEWWDNNDGYHAPEMLLSSAGRTERYFGIGQWRGIMRRYGWYNGPRTLAVKVLSSSQGRCDLRFEYAASSGAGRVHDYAQQRVTSVNPPLLPDYNRDGRIDLDDVARYLRRSVFRYWINECKVTGDVWEEPSLFEGVADALVGRDNWRNGHVDGRYDLVNLFPVAVSAEPFLDAWGGSGNVNVKVHCLDGDDVFRFTLADVGHSDAGSVRTAPRFNIAGQPLHSATMNWLTNSLTISYAQYNANFGRNSALIVCEAAKPTWLGLRLSVEVDGNTMYAFRLPMNMSAVDNMFRFVNIRGAYENEMFTFSGTNAPPGNPDSELADKDVFFVHGFNVDLDGARNWNREMFKRFWVSGMNARYWGVTWTGDSGVVNGLHYHRDVRQALMTAPTLRNLVNSNGVDAVVIGHSLGNMVVSEALLKDMNASTYIMLDAAVASEAYRPELQADSSEIVDKYVPSDWDGYHERTWAANWYTWFTNTPNDARADIGWAGHFAPLLQMQGLTVYNFYSSGDEVFDEATETPGIATGVFHWPTFNLEWPFIHLNWTLDAFPWQKQEVFKGVNAAGLLSAGWGFHCWTTNINNETVWIRYSAEDANAMVANGSIITNAVFDRGVSAMFDPTISDYDKADILAFHIPAVSSPAGKVSIRTVQQGQTVKDFDLNELAYRANGWGREGVDVENEQGQVITTYNWLHSDVKNMAYYFVYPAFTNIVEKGALR